MNRKKIMQKVSLALDYFSSTLKSYTKIRLPYNKQYSGSINILATGPSLKTDLELILSNDKSTRRMVVNDFALSEFYGRVQAEYYIIIDPAYFLPASSISERDLENRTKVFDNINSKTTWNMQLIIPSSAYKLIKIEDFISNKNISITSVNFTQLSQVDDPWYYKMLHTNKAASFSNVLGAAIYVSINLGYDEIRIFGADHSWTKDIRVNEKNQVCTVYRHFYEKEEELVPWMTPDNHYFEMHKILQALYTHFFTYKLLDKYAKMCSCRILNCTKGSFIDAFERSSINELIKS